MDSYSLLSRSKQDLLLLQFLCRFETLRTYLSLLYYAYQCCLCSAHIQAIMLMRLYVCRFWYYYKANSHSKLLDPDFHNPPINFQQCSPNLECGMLYCLCVLLCFDSLWASDYSPQSHSSPHTQYPCKPNPQNKTNKSGSGSCDVSHSLPLYFSSEPFWRIKNTCWGFPGHVSIKPQDSAKVMD